MTNVSTRHLVCNAMNLAFFTDGGVCCICVRLPAFSVIDSPTLVLAAMNRHFKIPCGNDGGMTVAHHEESTTKTYINLIKLSAYEVIRRTPHTAAWSIRLGSYAHTYPLLISLKRCDCTRLLFCHIKSNHLWSVYTWMLYSGTKLDSWSSTRSKPLCFLFSLFYFWQHKCHQQNDSVNIVLY